VFAVMLNDARAILAAILAEPAGLYVNKFDGARVGAIGQAPVPQMRAMANQGRAASSRTHGTEAANG
jgi:hypothetical protein